MEKKKIDRIIEAVRNYMTLKEEGMMVGNAPGSQGGFSGSSDPKGPTAGFDPVMGLKRRKGPQIKLPPGSRKRWRRVEK
jgi:hypothetical protein